MQATNEKEISQTAVPTNVIKRLKRWNYIALGIHSFSTIMQIFIGRSREKKTFYLITTRQFYPFPKKETFNIRKRNFPTCKD